MAQHDYVIDNGPGLAVRTDINAVLQAIVTNNSGNIEPQNMFPGMVWLDTSITPNGQVRMRNQGNSGWIDLPIQGRAPTQQRFTSSGTWTRPVGCIAIDVQVLGSGGGGGTAAATSAGSGSIGGGGGGGGCCRRLIANPPATAPVTVAAAAGAGATGGQSIFNGGTGLVMTANGGGTVGAQPAVTVPYPGGRGLGGTATGGDINVSGERGGPSLVFVAGSVCALAGDGGNSPFGQGGMAAANAGTGAWNQAGSAATGFGAGGGGGASINGNAAAPGGAATQGLVIVTEYY